MEYLTVKERCKYGPRKIFDEGAKKMKILIIEDDIEICDMVSNFLLDESFEVVATSNDVAGCTAFEVLMPTTTKPWI